MADIFNWYDDLLQSRYQPRASPLSPIEPDPSQQMVRWQDGQPQPYQPSNANTEAAYDQAWGMTGIPDMQQAYKAYQRGEYLPALGQGAYGAATMAANAAPFVGAAARAAPAIGRAAAPVMRDVLPALQGVLADESGAQRIPNPIRAYHGSPHDFDRFDTSKIGTGEGNQSFTRGLYFAEAEPVAKGYRDSVKNMALIDANNKRMAEIVREMEPLRRSGSYREFKDPRGYELAAEYDRLMAEKMQPGHMYEVDIHATPQSFLDLDKPIGAQSDQVRAALERGGALMGSMDSLNAFDAVRAAAVNPYRAADLFNRGGDPLHLSAADVAYRLHKSGIPGARYLDEFSRGPAAANRRPTRNYSIYDDELIDIIRKYGIVPPVAGGTAVSLGFGSEPGAY